jgi:minimal PKS ketosynthase (KS/KS alpha)
VSLRRVVVTGIGAVALGGTGREAFWERIVSGRPAIRRISRFDPSPYRSRVAAECYFDPSAAGLTPREVRRCDRYAQFALAASAEAVADSGLGFSPASREDRDAIGVCLGTAVGATTTLEKEYVVASDGGRRWDVDADHCMPFLYRAMHRS